MRIGLRLTIGFLGVALLVAAVGFYSRHSNQIVRGNVEQLGHQDIIAVVDAADMAMALHDCHAACHELLEASARTGDSESGVDAQAAIDEIHRSEAMFARSLSRSREVAGAMSAPRTGTIKFSRHDATAVLVDLEREFDVHAALLRQFLMLAETDHDAALIFLEHKHELQINQNMLPLIHNYKAMAQSDVTSRVQAIVQSTEAAEKWINVTTIGGILIALVFGVLFSRYFKRRLSSLSDGAREIGQGHFASRIDMSGSDEFAQVASAFNAMATELEATVVKKTYIDNIIHSMHDMLVVVDGSDRISAVNQAVLDETGYTEADLLGHSLSVLYGKYWDKQEEWQSPSQQECDGKWQTRSDDTLPVQLSISKLTSSDSGAFVVVARNVTQQRQAEQILRQALADKETLLREVHHRVKNNLQIVSSLLNLQANESDDPAACRLFRESQGRIRSMALIHEQLYRSGDFASVDFEDYVTQLTTQLHRTYELPNCSCAFIVQVDDVSLDLERAIPCGMMINELATNALEHAFVGRPSGTVRVAFSHDESYYHLIVDDDGIGLSTNGKPEDGKSLGLRVVESLVRQLGGVLEVESTGGTKFTARFPVNSAYHEEVLTAP